MKKLIISLMLIPFMAGMASCNEIGDNGSIDWEQWKADSEAAKNLPVYQTYTLNHPCLLHTQDDIDFVRQHITEEPYASALAKLKRNSHAQPDYTPHPVLYLARLDANNWAQMGGRWEDAGIADLWYSGIHNNYTHFMNDAAAAYQLALRYALEDDAACADAARNIMVRWANENKGLLRNKDGNIIDPNEKLIMFQPYQMAVAAELLRGYNGFGESDDFRKVCKWLDDSFYAEAHGQLELQNTSGGGHYWFNWDLASLATILSIGVLTDNQNYINEAIMYFKGVGGGPGNILKGVPYLHQDPDSDETLGQANELGRDQGHNVLCTVVLGTFCRMGLAIGDDLFAFDDYRALAMAEYNAKYNLAHKQLYPDPGLSNAQSTIGANPLADFVYKHDTFPYTTYTYGDAGTMTEPSAAGRGDIRPGWDVWAGYANTHGRSAIYCNEMADRLRPDGGGGDYGSNSGGFDQLGFSTLMYYRP